MTSKKANARATNRKDRGCVEDQPQRDSKL
jgi:hypothetical protein